MAPHQEILVEAKDVLPNNHLPERCPETSIDVLIVGAGVGGLSAALECWRKGHNVRILERAPTMSTAGDIFTIGLSGRRFITAWPDMKKELDDISFPEIRMGFLKHTGEVVIPPSKPPQPQLPGVSGPPMSIQSRPLFHKMLYTQVRKLGIDVQFNKRAVHYAEDASLEKAFVKTHDDEFESADIIITADGIGSRSQDLVSGMDVKASSSGMAVYRTAYPLEKAMQNPLVKERFGLYDGIHPMMLTHLGPGVHTKIFVHNDEMTWSLTHPTNASAAESWHHCVSTDEVIETLNEIPDWDPAFEELIKTTPKDKTINWPLIWRDPQPQWTSPHGRVLQLGDAAHYFLPTSGNGATQAIEDAVSIASCLHIAGNKHNVPAATKVHNTLRFERVSCTQLLGFFNADAAHRTDWEAVKHNPSLVKPKVPKWVFMHDAEKYAYDNFTQAKESLDLGVEPFRNTNIPPGYTYKPWSIESVLRERDSSGIQLEGDWS